MASVLYKVTSSRRLSTILVSLFFIFLLPKSVLLQEAATENNDLTLEEYPTDNSSSNNIELPKIGNGSFPTTNTSSSTTTEGTAGNATTETITPASTAIPITITCPPPVMQIPTTVVPCPAPISDQTLEDIAELKSKIHFMYIVTIVTLLFYLVNMGAGCFNICLKMSNRNNRSI